MPTDDKYVRLFNKKILSLVDVKDRFLDYLVSTVRDESENLWVDGVFSSAAPVVAVSNNQVNIGAGATIRAANGLGRTIKLAATDSRFQNINIPPDPGAAKIYTVGIEQSDVDGGLVTNPRTGEQEYDYKEELPGRLGTPNSVTDDGDGTMTIVVDSILDASEDHSGRKVRVWLKSRDDGGPGPLATTEAAAFETLTVTWSGTQNEIATAGALGQSTISTTAADYRIMLEGPTVKLKTNEDLRSTSGAVFLADVTAAAASSPISTISTTDQRLLPVHSVEVPRWRKISTADIAHRSSTWTFHAIDGYWELSTDSSSPLWWDLPLDRGDRILGFRLLVNQTGVVSDSIIVDLQSLDDLSTTSTSERFSVITSVLSNRWESVTYGTPLTVEDDKSYVFRLSAGGIGTTTQIKGVEIQWDRPPPT